MQNLRNYTRYVLVLEFRVPGEWPRGMIFDIPSVVTYLGYFFYSVVGTLVGRPDLWDVKGFLFSFRGPV